MGFRVAVLVPCRSQVEAPFALDLAMLMGHTSLTLVGPEQPLEALSIFFDYGTYIWDQRLSLAQKALGKFRATHLLYLDSDMRFPKDALARLLARNKPIVGASYSGRKMPAGTTAMMRRPGGMLEVVYTYPWSTGLQKVDVLGFGCILISAEVFQKTPEPWFLCPNLSEPGQPPRVEGEDAFFERQAALAGFDTLVDHDVSQEVRHIGTWEFEHQHAISMKTGLREAKEHFIVPDTPEPPSPVALVKEG